MSCQSCSMCCGSRPINRPADWASISFAAFADSGDARISLDRHHHIALIEERVRVRWKIRSHARDFHLWKGGKGG